MSYSHACPGLPGLQSALAHCVLASMKREDHRAISGKQLTTLCERSSTLTLSVLLISWVRQQGTPSMTQRLTMHRSQ